MYVCLCNGFTSRDVRRVIGEGAGSVAGVYRACGAKPNCGRCKDTIRDLLDESPTRASQTALCAPALVAAE